jgi:hypothetical protein
LVVLGGVKEKNRLFIEIHQINTHSGHQVHPSRNRRLHISPIADTRWIDDRCDDNGLGAVPNHRTDVTGA